MADDITPLRGEGRTVGRITGLWGELMAEFIGMFVLISFGDGVVAVAVAGAARLGPDRGSHHDLQRGGRLAADHLGLGDGRRLRRLGGGRRERRPPQPGGDAGVRRRGASSPGPRCCPTGAPRCCGAFVGAALVFLVYHNAIDAFNLAAHTPKSGGQALATYSIFATFPAGYFHGGYGGPLIDQIVGTAFLLMLRRRAHRRAEHGRRVQPGPAGHRPGRGRDRHVLRRRTRATPSTRPVTSVPGCSPSSPAGGRWPCLAHITRSAARTSPATSGYRSSGPSSAASSACSSTTCSSATSCTPGSRWPRTSRARSRRPSRQRATADAPAEVPEARIPRSSETSVTAIRPVQTPRDPRAGA